MLGPTKPKPRRIVTGEGPNPMVHLPEHVMKWFNFGVKQDTVGWIWVNFITTSLFSLTIIIGPVGEMIPKWPNNSG
jgi:hypothetical protein